MALFWRLLSAARQAERYHYPLCRFLSTSRICSGRIVPFLLTDIGEGIRDVTIKEWFVKPGDYVNQFDSICEVQSDKASVTITSRYDGVIKTLHVKVDDIAIVGTPLLDFEVDDNSEATTVGDVEKIEKSSDGSRAVSDLDKVKKTDEPELNLEKVLVTPAVRRIAMENNINLKDVSATGKQGRVLKEDILMHLQKTAADSDPSIKRDVPRTGVMGKTVKPKGYSRHMWKTMTRSLSIPHFVYSDECNMDKVTNLYNDVKNASKERGIPLTLSSFFVKATSRALEQWPELNAWLDEENQTMRVLDNHNIGIAMNTPNGLVVPNIKNVQNLSIVAIAKELNRLKELGKKASIPLSDLTDTTFSLSNMGMVGGTYMKAVISSPQVMIGAFGKVQRLPRFKDDCMHSNDVVPVNMMSISWSADHRVLDGVTVAQFSNLWKYYMENPTHLLIGM